MTLPPLDPMAPRFFLDSSVIISGIISQRGASYALLLLAELGLIRLVVCPYIRKEVERNLNLKTPEILPLYHQVMAKINWEIIPDPPVDDVLPLTFIIPAKDAPVLAAAMHAGPHRLVTLDVTHFLQVSTVAEQSHLVICLPGDLIREIRSLLAQGFRQK